jgi:hypothetical protein
MVKVEKKVKVHKDGKVLEAQALFDTGSRRSYFSKEFAEKIGYEPYEKPLMLKQAILMKLMHFIFHRDGEALSAITLM